MRLLTVVALLVLLAVPARAQAPTADGTRPTIGLSGGLYERRGKVADGGLWTLGFRVTDGTAAHPQSGVVEVTTRFAGQVSWRLRPRCAGQPNCSVSEEDIFDTADAPEGRTTARVTARDAAGNVASRSFSFTNRHRAFPCRRVRSEVFYAGRRVGRRGFSVASQSCTPAARDEDGDHSVSYAYGTCDASRYGSCALPLDITSRPLCEWHVGLANFPRPSRRGRLLGVPAAWFGSTAVELDTRRTSITIAGDTAGQVRRALRDLRRPRKKEIPDGSTDIQRLHRDPGPPLHRLPAPDRRILRQKQACQLHSGRAATRRGHHRPSRPHGAWAGAGTG